MTSSIAPMPPTQHHSNHVKINLAALKKKLEGLEERYVLGVIELPSPPKRKKVLIAQDFKCREELHVIEPIKGLRGGCRPNIELINADSTS